MSSSIASAACPVTHDQPAGVVEPFDPPLPPTLSLGQTVGFARQLRRDPYQAFATLVRDHGDIVRVRLPGINLIVLGHPDHVNHVSVRHAGRYNHGHEMVHDIVHPDHPRSVPTREGEDWKRARRVLNPQFSEGNLKRLAPIMTASITEQIDGWSTLAGSGEQFELQEKLGMLAMSALVSTMVSPPPDDAWLAEFVHSCEKHGDYVIRGVATYLATSRLPLGLGWLARRRSMPWPRLRDGYRNAESIFNRLDVLIERRLQTPGQTGDLLDLMLSARFEDGTAFARDELRSELGALLFAGHETTAAALAWAIAMLGTHPEALQLAVQEVDRLGDAPLGYDMLAELPYVRACFDEALRIQGTPALPRWPKNDDVIGGYRIPAGSWVMLPMWALHHDPRFWREPERFDPERFLTDQIDRHAYFPFGVGQRRCLGMRMANLEGTLALAHMLRRYEFELPAGWAPAKSYHMATGLAALPVRIKSRQPS